MAKYRMIHTEFWDDPKVVEEMTPEDKFFFLYLLTNSNTTQIGIYQITKKQMAFDMGYSSESVNALLQRFRDHHKIIRYNDETRELAIKNWGKYNLAKGGKPVMDCIKSELKSVKDLSMIHYISERIDKADVKALYDSYNDTCHGTLTERGQKGKEKEKEKEKEKQLQARKSLEEPVQKKNDAVAADSPGMVFRFYQANMGPLVQAVAEHLNIMIDESSEELVHEALKRAVIKNANNKMAFAEKILRSWHDQRLKTLADVEAADKAFERRKQTQTSGYRGKPVREELLPEWLNSPEEESVPETVPHDSADLEAEKNKLLEQLAARKQGAPEKN